MTRSDAQEPKVEQAVEQNAIRLRLDISYVGTRFHGWQEQPNHLTVQGELKKAISYLLGRPATPIGAGRTDAGVHARGQVAHLTVNGPEEFERLQRALQRRLPEDVSVNTIRVVSPGFHAIQSAQSRRYHYYLSFRRDIFRPHEWQVHWNLDRTAMDEAVACFLGDHDFSSFCKTSSLKDDGNVCRLDLCAFEWDADSAIFQIRGNRFLHHMVRIMVGTLVEVGRAERSAAEVPGILAGRDRGLAGCMAPACGLFMEEIEYPMSLLDPEYRSPDSPADCSADSAG
ncbi:MAG: tRNA pseudouridine(38-40) synthase TruA [Gemmatimonadales bacterium]|nr:tRNA pseudouridine(38-40) synthase TruA [Gemmatimonadales bacterium]